LLGAASAAGALAPGALPVRALVDEPFRSAPVIDSIFPIFAFASMNWSALELGAALFDVASPCSVCCRHPATVTIFTLAPDGADSPTRLFCASSIAYANNDTASDIPIATIHFM
jgi:uncharacterized protein YcbX